MRIRYSVVDVATGLRAAGSRVRIPVGAKYFSVVQNVQTGCGTHPAHYYVDTELLSRG
jgi:hypothetical protein